MCAGPDTYGLLGVPEPERMRSVRFSFALREPADSSGAVLDQPRRTAVRAVLCGHGRSGPLLDRPERRRAGEHRRGRARAPGPPADRGHRAAGVPGPAPRRRARRRLRVPVAPECAQTPRWPTTGGISSSTRASSASPAPPCSSSRRCWGEWRRAVWTGSPSERTIGRMTAVTTATTRTADGRTLAFCEWGDPEGHPGVLAARHARIATDAPPRRRCLPPRRGAGDHL